MNDRCPVTTDEFSSPLYELAYRGATVRFCCNKCRKTFRDDPAPYLAHLPQLPPTPSVAEVAAAPPTLEDVHAAQVEAWLERWLVPAVIAFCAVLTGWLVFRARRRRRRIP